MKFITTMLATITLAFATGCANNTVDQASLGAVEDLLKSPERACCAKPADGPCCANKADCTAEKNAACAAACAAAKAANKKP